MWVDIVVTDPPASEPVDLAELKSHANIVDPTDAGDLAALNTLLTGKIVAARQKCERFTRRSLITQTIDVWYDSWDGPGIIENIPRGNIQSIKVFTYIDGETGAGYENDSSTYVLANNTLIFSSWLTFRAYRGIRLEVISGYGDDPEDVPEALKAGILAYATYLYEYRAGEGPEIRYQAQAGQGTIPQGVLDLWAPYQIKMV